MTNQGRYPNFWSKNLQQKFGREILQKLAEKCCKVRRIVTKVYSKKFEPKCCQKINARSTFQGRPRSIRTTWFAVVSTSISRLSQQNDQHSTELTQISIEKRFKWHLLQKNFQNFTRAIGLIEILLSKIQGEISMWKNKQTSERSGAPRARWPDYDKL